MKTVWAYKQLKSLDYKTGFVQLEDKMANKLLKSKSVQDPLQGANALSPIETPKPTK